MAKSADWYKQQHEGDMDAALAAAVSDVAKRENQNTAARAFKRAYTPLVESLKLPADVDTDSEGEAQTLAARAVESMGKPGTDEGVSEHERHAGIFARALIELGIDPNAFIDALDAVPEQATDEEWEQAFAAQLKPVTEVVGKALELERKVSLTEAATALGKPADALAEILEGKTLEKRTVKATDGSESEQWGIPQGDTFKPLSELRSIQLLGTAQPDKPAPAPLPTGQRGGNAPAPKTVEQRTAEVRKEISI